MLTLSSYASGLRKMGCALLTEEVWKIDLCIRITVSEEAWEPQCCVEGWTQALRED